MLNGIFKQRSSGLRRGRLSAIITAAAIVNVFSGAVHAAGDAHTKAEAARPIADLVTVCASCHGENGKGINETIPNIGGQHRDYLAYAIKAYKTGARDNAIMKGMSAALTNEEIASLARYYARQEDTVYTPSRSTWRGD